MTSLTRGPRRVGDAPLSIVDLAADTAARHPEATAVEFEGRRLTYRALDAHVSEMAAALIEAGAGPGAIVGLFFDRSLEMVPALLAVLACGAAYLPLDPKFPAERLAYMLADAGAQAILTRAPLAPALHAVLADAGGLAPAVLTVSCERSPSGSGPRPSWRPKASDLAYLLYTSGSTGRPKGVAIPHGALANLLAAMREIVEVRPPAQDGSHGGDRWLAVTTISFDIAALEILLPLAVGASVVVASDTIAADGRLLGDRLVAGDITHVQATPSTWRMVIDAGWPGSGHLRVLCGGEALPSALASELLARCGRLWNVYGPTETTIWSTAIEVTDALLTTSIVPIGRPILDTTVHVLDERRHEQPIGVPGELYIGGAGLAAGYWHQPALTDERFVTLAVDGVPQRLYRTGDLARFRADGLLEFLGRIDQQVKIRGFRIETGEVEAALMALEEIADAAVVPRTDPAGVAILVAFVVPASPAEPFGGAAIRDSLRRHLPEAMVPTVCVALPALPRTSNRKIDRRALEALPIERSGRTGVAPRTTLERQIAAAWQSLLAASDIGVDDNFFELGGHSLTAARLVFQLSRELGVDIRLADLFRHPTVATLADFVSHGSVRGSTSLAGFAARAAARRESDEQLLVRDDE